MTRSEVSLRSQTTPLLEFGFTFNVSGVHISWLSAKKQWITQHLNERRRRPPSSLNLVRLCRAGCPVVGAPSRNQVRLCWESRHVVEGKSSRNRSPGKPSKKHRMNNTQLVEEYWCNALNRKDVKEILKLCAPGCECWFVGADEGMSMEEFCSSMMNDNYVRWESIEEIEPGVVRIQNFAGRSTRIDKSISCLLYTSPSPRDRTRSRMPSSA